MIGIDTNILVRFLVDDHPGQNDLARSFMANRTADDPAYVSAVVLAEAVWVLTRRLKYPLSTITELLQGLLATDGLIFEHTEELDALLSNDQPRSDLADHLISWAAQRAGCHRTVTFDETAARRVPGMELLA